MRASTTSSVEGDEAIVGVGSLRLFQKILVLSVADGSVVLVDSFADLTSA
jgi:hypothetical protein